MKKTAVIIYGPPGAGKGTQAELLAKNLGLIHFDTGRRLKRILYSKQAETEPILKKEKEIHNSGRLNTPSWVVKIVREATVKIANAGLGIVYSGSPRTLFEAEDGEKHQGIISTLEKNYGKKNIFVFELFVPERESVARNKKRLICRICSIPILTKSNQKKCGFCGAPAWRRPDDNPVLMKTRLEEYHKRTAPILDYLRKRGYKINKIDGAKLPYKVHESILNVISQKNRTN